MIIGLVPDDQMEKAEWRAKWTIRAFNIFFYTFLVVLFGWQEIALLTDKLEPQQLWFDVLNIFAKVMSAAMLIFSIQRLRRLIK